MSSRNVFVFVPNLIGYARVALLAVAMSYAFTNSVYFFWAYSASQLLDAADGFAARALKQSSQFGAVLDMVTDRVSSNMLLFVLSRLHEEFFFFFAFLAALDYSSHWVQMYSSIFCGQLSHKEIANDRPTILQFYYTNKPFLFMCCLCQEAALLAIYLLGMLEEWRLAHRIAQALLFLAAPLGCLKQIINLIQLLDASKQIVKKEQTKSN